MFVKLWQFLCFEGDTIAYTVQFRLQPFNQSFHCACWLDLPASSLLPAASNVLLWSTCCFDCLVFASLLLQVFYVCELNLQSLSRNALFFSSANRALQLDAAEIPDRKTLVLSLSLLFLPSDIQAHLSSASASSSSKLSEPTRSR